MTARPEDWAAAEPGHRALSSAALPLDGAPSTHILKPQPWGRLAGLVEAEAWGMEVARHVTETAGSAILDLPDAPPTLAVERFDRVETERGLVRLHQEDCAQALGIEPGRKYAATATPTKSDPTYKGIAELLSRYAADSLEERKRLLRHLFVNTVLGNTDAHAKNYALLHGGDEVCLAPLYDVVPALEITPNVLFMGLRIDGRIRIDRIERENIVAEARSWGLPARVVDEVLGKAAEDVRLGIAVSRSRRPPRRARFGAVEGDGILIFANTWNDFGKTTVGAGERLSCGRKREAGHWAVFGGSGGRRLRAGAGGIARRLQAGALDLVRIPAGARSGVLLGGRLLRDRQLGRG